MTLCRACVLLLGRLTRHVHQAKAAPSRGNIMRFFSGIAALLPAVLLCITPARAGVIEDWNELMMDYIVENNVPPIVGQRLMAMIHTAQWRAMTDYGRQKNVDVRNARNDPTLSIALAAAASSAARSVTTTLFGMNATFSATANRLFSKHVAVRVMTMRDPLAVGESTARAVLMERSTDKAEMVAMGAPFRGSMDPGKWRPVPPAFLPQMPEMWKWANVTPFALDTPMQFRSGPPPDIDSQDYRNAYEEVYQHGGLNSRRRSQDQTDVAQFWDVARPDLFFQKITREVSIRNNFSVPQAAMTFATVSAALFDSKIAAMDSKLTFQHWRPVTAVNVGYGQRWPADLSWTPLLASTNPLPEYPAFLSAAAGATGTVLRAAMATDRFNFQLHHPSNGSIRTYDSFAAVTREINDGRVNGGESFRFSVNEGEQLGNRVAARAIEKYVNPFGPPAEVAAPRRRRRSPRKLRASSA